MAPWLFSSRRKSLFQSKECPETPSPTFQTSSTPTTLPETQSVLLLHAPRQAYQLTHGYALPVLKDDVELLVRVRAVGLNPIDWKAPDFNFGIPTLPYISGRELVGEVVQPPKASSRLRKGDILIIPSTDYRDVRKAAFQEYAIASSFNTIRLPTNISIESGSILGVAFVASVLALGICMGVDFSAIANGPDLLHIVRSIDPEKLPIDIRKECLHGINEDNRAKEGDYLVIWGGSSTCAYIMKQLARLAKLSIISVTDSRKHGIRLSNHSSIRPDLLVDSHDPVRAIEIIRGATANNARFGFDTQGKESAAHLLQSLRTLNVDTALPKTEAAFSTPRNGKLPTPPTTPSEFKSQCSHLVGLTGLPKTAEPTGMAFHSVPIKLFHEVPEVGEAMVSWCERLLTEELLVPPDVVGTVEGLRSVNEGLDRLRRGEISGGRLVVKM